MEVISSARSLKATKTPVEFIEGSESSIDEIKWSEEMSIHQGFIELEKKFYPFKQVGLLTVTFCY